MLSSLGLAQANYLNSCDPKSCKVSDTASGAPEGGVLTCQCGGNEGIIKLNDHMGNDGGYLKWGS